MNVPVEPTVDRGVVVGPRRPGGSGARIDGVRMLRRLKEVSRYGAEPGGGLSRTGLSEDDIAAREYVARRCREDGLVTRVDQAGNLIVHRANLDPRTPVILLGSHLDSVTHGGRLDGTYGVIAACEVVAALARSRTELACEPVAIAFTNEEGAGFAYPFLGSLAVVGDVDVAYADTLADSAGTPLRQALLRAGGDLDTISDAAWPRGSVAYFLELHIEQGVVLETEGASIGIVDAIVGRTILDITVSGVQGHAGTVPMALRRDALPVAAQVVLAVQLLAAGDRRCAVATVGVLNPQPNVTNVIPGQVRLTAEMRDGDPGRLRAAEQVLTAELARLAERTGTDIAVQSRRVAHPVACGALAREAIAAAAGELGLAYRRLDSGAGHDAQIVARIAPVGMIFVPSRGGISHAPQEHTDDHHLLAGAETLLRSVLRLAGVRP